ncbi:hypothetical protein Tco_0534368 [Tanacetum coccineum]
MHPIFGIDKRQALWSGDWSESFEHHRQLWNLPKNAISSLCCTVTFPSIDGRLVDGGYPPSGKQEQLSWESGWEKTLVVAADRVVGAYFKLWGIDRLLRINCLWGTVIDTHLWDTYLKEVLNTNQTQKSKHTTPWLLIPIEGLRKPRSGGLGESNHMKAILVRESREMEDGLVILGGKWEVIQNGNGPVSITTDTQGQIKVLPPRTAEEILARERERKARTTLLMALPEDHLAKFHKMTDAKEMWEAIKSRFGGNDESKKMQKYILKQQFEGFSVSNSEGLHKSYDRFQSLLSQLEIHGASVSTEDENQKFLRVFENDVKGSTASSSSTQNVAFVSKNTSSTNDVSTTCGVSNLSGQNSQYEHTSSYSLLANQSSCPQLDHEDLEQLDEFDLEEMDLKWQVAMISMRMKKFYNKTGHFARECITKGNQDSRRRDAWNSRNKDGRRSGKQEDSKALVTIDGEGVDWTSTQKKKKIML